jgi:hypothetical protein
MSEQIPTAPGDFRPVYHTFRSHDGEREFIMQFYGEVCTKIVEMIDNKPVEITEAEALAATCPDCKMIRETLTEDDFKRRWFFWLVAPFALVVMLWDKRRAAEIMLKCTRHDIDITIAEDD